MDTPSNLNLKENLTNQYVAYLDVMGFSNLVNKGNVTRLESYFNKIIEILDNLKIQKSNIQSFLISDSIILITPDSKQDFLNLIIAIRRIQSALLWKKILLRGAVSYGEVFYNQKNNIIVGKGFIKAYLLESEANFPRVIIDPAIIKNFGKDKNDFLNEFNSLPFYYNYEKRLIYSKSEFSKISDDAIFIDYANKTIKQSELNGNIKKIYETILDNLYIDQKLYSKYVWLRDYYLEILKKTEFYVSQDKNGSEKFKTSLSVWIQTFEGL